jgi:hypothetical protein
MTSTLILNLISRTVKNKCLVFKTPNLIFCYNSLNWLVFIVYTLLCHCIVFICFWIISSSMFSDVNSQVARSYLLAYTQQDLYPLLDHLPSFDREKILLGRKKGKQILRKHCLMSIKVWFLFCYLYPQSIF